jgi:type I restriction enzyme S subunit
MSFPRYPAYKPSGVEWLGEVPEHWEIARLGFLCSKIGSGKTPLGGALAYLAEGILFIRSQNVYDDGMHLGDVVYISEAADAGQSWSRVFPGDVLLNITGASLGRTCLVPEGFPSANVNQHVCIIRLGDAGLRSFVSMVLKSSGVKAQFDATQNGAAREGLNFDQISKLVFAVPSQSEQVQIASFLDHETAKIDALIAEQQRLIELLQEKRQAVISHAVTKGLNPDAPMKDSGVEWLGEVPEHWDNHRLKNLFALKHGYAFDGNHFSDEGLYALMTPGNFIETGGFRRKDPEKYYAANDVPSEFILREGQMLVAMTEQAPGLVGTALFVPKGQVYLHNQRLGLVTRLRSDILDTSFLYWLMNSPMLKAKAGISATGQKVRHSSPQKILENEICLPPLDEQRDIAQALFDSGERCNRLIDDSDQSIRLLQERRSALISAAVTGQIDVRGLVPETEVS